MLYVIKKDGTREEFNPQKIVAAVNKSAERILYTFSDEEKDFICRFAQEHADSLGKNEIEIQEMHNIVEGALELSLIHIFLVAGLAAYFCPLEEKGEAVPES